MRSTRVGRRLLDVDVLAGGERVHRDRRVGEVGRADEHRVDVVAIEDAAVIGDHLQLERLPRRCHEPLQLGGIDLAAGEPLRRRVFRANESNTRPDRLPQPITASRIRLLAPCTRALGRKRGSGRGAERANGGFQERSTIFQKVPCPPETEVIICPSGTGAVQIREVLPPQRPDVSHVGDFLLGELHALRLQPVLDLTILPDQSVRRAAHDPEQADL